MSQKLTTCVQNWQLEAYSANIATVMYQSIPSLTISPRATPGDSHILVAPGVGFSPPLLPRGLPGGLPGDLKSKYQSSIILKKKRDFCFAS